MADFNPKQATVSVGTVAVSVQATVAGHRCCKARCTQSKWTKGIILTKIIGTYKSEMSGNSAGNYVTLHEFHSLLICNGVK